MGSRVRTAVGTDFEGALVTLAGHVEARRNEAGRSGKKGADDREAVRATTAAANNESRPVFTAEQYAAARESGGVYSELLCTDFASAEDRVESISSLPRDGQIERLQKMAAAAETADASPLLSAFLRLADGDGVSAGSVRQFLASVALSRPPAGASSELGRLVGLHAKLSAVESKGPAVVDAISTALLSVEGRDKVAVADFVGGYAETVSGARRVEDCVSSLSRALSTGVILPRKQLPVMPKLRDDNDAKGAKAQLRAWKRWAHKISPDKVVNANDNMASSESTAVTSDEVDGRVEEAEPEEKETAEALLELRKEGTKDGEAALPTISEDAAVDAGAVGAAPAARRRKRRKSSDAGEPTDEGGKGPAAAGRKASDASDSAGATATRKSRRRAESNASEGSSGSAALRRSSRRK